jgi:protein Tob/BTG
MMQKEVDSAVQFICGLLRARRLSLDLVEAFRTVLCEVMYGRYEGHWFPDKPCKGSAYRCVRINDHNVDPLLVKAASRSGLTPAQLHGILPSQLTIWVDPHEVSYRIGEDGSIGTLYDANAPPPKKEDDEEEDLGSTGSASPLVTPSQSPVPTSSGCSTDDEAALPTRFSVVAPAATCRQEEVESGGGGGVAADGRYPVLITS